MWMLLRPTSPRAGTGATAGDCSYVPAQFHLYMHPGRTLVGTIDSDQAERQFDWRRARRYASLAAAEKAEQGARGFLLLRRSDGAAFFAGLNG